MAEPAILERTIVVRRGRRLERFTIAWNALEGLVAVVAGAMAGSISLVGFDICKLELGKSTLADVSRIFPKYGGYVGSHDDTGPSCSPDGCFYVLYVENPISKLIPIFPRTALFATVRIFDNTLRERSLSIAETKGQHYSEAFVKQSADSHFKEDTRIITESMVPRKGVAVRTDNSARFIELANGLRLACLVFPGACAAPDDMLPYLKSRQVPG